MSKLQNRINELVKYILEETNHWNDVQLSKEQIENMAAILIARLALDNVEDANIQDAYNEMLDDEMEPPDNPDQFYAMLGEW